MLQGRWEHNVIFDGNYFLVIGGSDKLMTEKCSYYGSKMTCQLQEPTLNEYELYPELFLVPADFCTESQQNTVET